MSNEAAVAAPHRHQGVLADMADRYGMNAQTFEATLRATVMPGATTREQLAAFLLVAKQYNLDPITKQIFAFEHKGRIVPVVSIDGWMTLINSHPQFDGMEFDDNLSNGKIISITCRMYRKDRTKPTTVTEYMSECVRGTDIWKKWPIRMLRHKAAIQAARYAFSFAGIIDEDEAQRMNDITPGEQQPTQQQAREPGKASRLSGILNASQQQESQAALEHNPDETVDFGDAHQTYDHQQDYDHVERN